MKPLVSIVLPVYNVDRYLSESLNSIVSQVYENIEVIAVNDGSTDSSLKILENFKGKITNFQIVTQTNKGLSGARNSGLHKATGEYVYFFDSDDIMDPKLIACCVKEAEKNNVDVVTFNSLTFGVKSNEQILIKSDVNKGIYSGSVFFKTVINSKSVWLPVWLFFYRTSFLREKGITYFEGIIHEDVLFTPQVLLLANKISYIDQPLYKYRIREGSIKTSSGVLKSIESHLIVCEELYKFGNHNHLTSEKKHLLHQFIYLRYIFILETVKLNYGNSDINQKNIRRIVYSAYKKKPIRKLFYKNYTTNVLFQFYKPLSAEIFETLDRYIISRLRRIYKFKLKKFINLYLAG